jgi:hypothetical protein
MGSDDSKESTASIFGVEVVYTLNMDAVCP